MSFSEKDKNFLLKLAHDSIGSAFDNKELSLDKQTISDELKRKLACFVTLTIDGELRGCIGHILPIQELYKDVIENAQAAAFSDSRFPELTEKEFKEIDIEISVLSTPKPFEYSSPAELMEYLKENKPGLIISKGFNQATFLPSVWEEIGTPEEFLTHLCLKAGLAPDEWQKGGLEIQTYTAENIEKN